MKSTLPFASLITLLFIEGCSSISPMNAAIQRGNLNEVQTLTAAGANLRAVASCGSGMSSTIDASPLRCAVWFNQPEIINFLVDHGADPDEMRGGGSALSLAATYGINKSATTLLERGANPNAGKPLSSAAFNGNYELMTLLIAKGADIDTAIAELKTWYDSWLPARNQQIDAAVRLLEKQQLRLENNAKPPLPQPTPAPGITREELANIVQAAVSEARAKDRDPHRSEAGPQADLAGFTLPESAQVFGERDLAVIVGIESYKNVPKSDYSYDDAMLVKKYFKTLGIKDRNIEFLTDDNASLSAIMKSVEAWLRNKAKPDSRIFFYYSGHGAPDPASGEAYLLPYDGDPNYLAVTGYPLKRLYEKLAAVPSTEIIVALDACFSGAGGRSVIAKGARPVVIMSSELPIARNIAVLTATQRGQISASSQEKGHGIFTYYFLKAIQDGKKSVAEIFEYLRPAVEDEAKTLNVQQTPAMNIDGSESPGRFVLRK